MSEPELAIGPGGDISPRRGRTRKEQGPSYLQQQNDVAKSIDTQHTRGLGGTHYPQGNLYPTRSAEVIPLSKEANSGPTGPVYTQMNTFKALIWLVVST